VRESRASQFAVALQPWRHVLVRADAVLHWERPLAFGCLLAGLTLAFALMAVARPAPLACLTLLCLLAVTADFAACYTAVCRRLSARGDSLAAAIRRIFAIRRYRPRAFALGAGAALLAVALIGASVSGLLLGYVAALGALLCQYAEMRTDFNTIIWELCKATVEV
uniref:DUF4395 domain-containing protein n=1 Tax=Macrostomum lignano TaxID=282301 RepID=A0A1I8GP63_9PLAT